MCVAGYEIGKCIPFRLGQTPIQVIAEQTAGGYQHNSAATINGRKADFARIESNLTLAQKYHFVSVGGTA